MQGDFVQDFRLYMDAAPIYANQWAAVRRTQSIAALVTQSAQLASTKSKTMSDVLIVYTSLFGNTEKLAQSVSEGAASVADTTVTLRIADEATIDEVRRCDALILSSPVHMGMR